MATKYFKNKMFRNSVLTGAFVIAGSSSLMAADPETASGGGATIEQLEKVLNMFLGLTGILLVLVVVLLYSVNKALNKGKESQNQMNSFNLMSFIRLFRTKAPEDELMDHNYDGIQEMDNDMPFWFSGLFYITIIFAIIYYFYYDITGIGNTQEEEYAAEMKIAEKQMTKYTDKDWFEKQTFKPMKEDADLNAGKEFFLSNCSACHGKAAEGNIGPNLTDKYWVYDGDFKGIVRTVTFGTKNGMEAWGKKKSPKEIQQTASYILTLQGSKPANAKEPQGEEWKN